MPYRLISLGLLCMFGFVSSAFAVLTIEITKSSDQASPIAIVPFYWQGSAAAPEDIAEIVKNDLERSGQFRALAESDMLEKPHSISNVRYFNWRALGADHLVIGTIKQDAPDRYTIEFRLLDVMREKQLIGFSYPSNEKNLRRTAHRISDTIYQTITGEKGAFNTRIAYITAKGSAERDRLYTLEVADTDGYNASTLLKSSTPIMSPSWSPDGKQLAYVSFKNRRSEVYIQSVYDGARESVAAFEGINGAPVWSPDGKKLALTLSRDGNPDIYVLDLQSKQLQQVTKHWSIDTEPAWMPDGYALLFTSGRSGRPQIYEVLLADGRPQRLTFEGDYNASPVISPDGQTIAMVHQQQGRFQIAAQDKKTGLFRILTDGRLDESPSFAPNGSMLIYASEHRGRGVLAVVSIDGRVKQRLVFSDGDIREPVWGPYLDR